MAAGLQKAKGGKKQRKFGRNKLGCSAYAGSHRREHNKIRRLKRHLKVFPDDKVAAKAVDIAWIAIRGYA